MGSSPTIAKSRYEDVSAPKATGATYTPPRLAEFVAKQLRNAAGPALGASSQPLRLLDPAVGHGELLYQLLRQLEGITRPVEVWGFDTNAEASGEALRRLQARFPRHEYQLREGDFLDAVVGAGKGDQTLFSDAGTLPDFDLIIANPPYVRTQVLGAGSAQMLSRHFGLTGRVDLYHAFLRALSRVLSYDGLAAVIVSNRFMTTRAGVGIRSELRTQFSVSHVWDLGDTKLFDAAVLPAVLLFGRKGGDSKATDETGFTSIYEVHGQTANGAQGAADPIEALEQSGPVKLPDGRIFHIEHGTLSADGDPGALWRLQTTETDNWLQCVERHAWATFGAIGKIRVGVKTCADAVFIRDDWHTLPEGPPELLRPLTTHHIGSMYRPRSVELASHILYPHHCINGRRAAVDLDSFPLSRAYLSQHRQVLERRSYVIDAGRRWFEIWVPQDPDAWALPKLVFRDISSEPCFWLDFAGTVVNGDCYWLTSERGDEDELWLAAAVANSSFIATFYDRKFNNKLYAGRRRFITQYVEQFPIPNPKSSLGMELVAAARRMYVEPSTELLKQIDELVSKAFGLT